MGAIASEAMDDFETPPQTPMFRAFPSGFRTAHSRVASLGEPSKLDLDDAKLVSSNVSEKESSKEIKPKDERPYYGIIVDGVHSHPNSVRVSSLISPSSLFQLIICSLPTWLTKTAVSSLPTVSTDPSTRTTQNLSYASLQP